VASCSLQFRKPVAKDLRRIPKPGLVRILEWIDALADEPGPPGCKKLSGQERYRIRQRRSRILYEITDDTLVVTVVKVAPAARVSLIQRNSGDEPLAPPETLRHSRHTTPAGAMDTSPTLATRSVTDPADSTHRARANPHSMIESG